MDEGRALSTTLDDRVSLPGVRVGERRSPGDASPSGETAPSPAAEADGSAADVVAALIAARDRERDRVKQQERDLLVLERRNRALHRDLLSLRVRGWRDEETIAELERELAAAREARDEAVRRGRQLARELADLRPELWRRLIFTGGARQSMATSARQPMLPGDGPFFRRGFRLAEGTAIVGTTAQRAKATPSGIMVFGPYVKLDPGIYVAEIEARLYRPIPVFANFTADAVCDEARRIVAQRKFGLCSAAGWRRFEMVFSIWEGEDRPDYEVRVSAPSGTPLAIGRLDLYRLDATPAATPPSAVAADPS
ncbi:MAG TPA: hypothetical protein VJR70_03615 [Stellaceae bacterium]|nr:hypothetical protein [Stellaceae bacterium]